MSSSASELSPSNLTKPLRLDHLQPKLCGTVVQVDADGDDIGRLQVMGVCVGRKIEVIQRGDPLILRVLGSRLGLSARLAQRVYVQACIDTGCQLPAAPSVCEGATAERN